ncbi:MAG: hypothetical protein ACREOW_18400 [Thermodesulfobacteriota bacterium]
MQIKYSKHIKNRLSLRKIEYDLPRRIFERSRERYYDMETGHLIATMRVNLYNKIREVMIAYAIKGDSSTLLTIHPLKENQKENRLQTGRWREIK